MSPVFAVKIGRRDLSKANNSRARLGLADQLSRTVNGEGGRHRYKDCRAKQAHTTRGHAGSRLATVVRGSILARSASLNEYHQQMLRI